MEFKTPLGWQQRTGSWGYCDDPKTQPTLTSGLHPMARAKGPFKLLPNFHPLSRTYELRKSSNEDWASGGRSGHRWRDLRLWEQDQTYRMIFLKIQLVQTAPAMKPIYHNLFQWVSIRVPLKVRHFIALIVLINMKAFMSHCVLCGCHRVIYSEKSSSWDTDQKHRQQRAWRHADMLKVSSVFPRHR